VEPSAIDDHEISVKTEDFLNGLTQSSRSSPRVDFCLDRKMAMLHQMECRQRIFCTGTVASSFFTCRVSAMWV